MRKLLTVLTVAALALGIAGMAQAATFDPGQSTFAITLGGINNPPTSVVEIGGGGSISLVDNGAGGHDIVIEASVWNTVNYLYGSALYTGVPIIDDIGITIGNAAFTATSNFTALNYLTNAPHPVVGPSLGGLGPVNGTLIIWALGNPAVQFDLAKMGGPAGGTTAPTVLGVPFSVTYQPWATAPGPITGITTNIISYQGVTGAGMTMRLTPSQSPKVLSTGGGFVTTSGGLPQEYHTVTPPPVNQLLSATSSGRLPSSQRSTATGSVTLVAPVRINTSPAVSGRVPGAGWIDLVFVPEPGTLLLLVTGAIALVSFGRSRARK